MENSDKSGIQMEAPSFLYEGIQITHEDVLSLLSREGLRVCVLDGTVSFANVNKGNRHLTADPNFKNFLVLTAHQHPELNLLEKSSPVIAEARRVTIFTDCCIGSTGLVPAEPSTK